MITLRTLQPEDLDLLEQIENDPAYWHLSSVQQPFTHSELQDYIANATQPIEEAGQYRWVICTDDQACGFIDLFQFDAWHRRAGVGIVLLPSFHGQGRAREALRWLVDHAQHTLHLHQLHATISASNTASIALFKHAGFTPCGVKKEWIWEGRKWNDALEFQLILDIA